jgi:hypothetical protein
MRARVVLEDCRYTIGRLEDARDEQEFRVRWVALVALLRAVGHVLDKVDGGSSAALRKAVDSRWTEWRRDRAHHGLFWDFIETERNSMLKTYQVGVQLGNVQVTIQQADAVQAFTLGECLFKPLLDGPYAGEDGRDVARDAISWWEAQLSWIESTARTFEA